MSRYLDGCLNLSERFMVRPILSKRKRSKLAVRTVFGFFEGFPAIVIYLPQKEFVARLDFSVGICFYVRGPCMVAAQPDSLPATPLPPVPFRRRQTLTRA